MGEMTKYLENLNRRIELQDELIEVLNNQVMDLTMMSKIELGDDVIEKIKELKKEINTLNNVF